MVTKKQRRARIARAGQQRREARRARREVRRHRLTVTLAALAAVAAVAALVTWIVIHDGDRTTSAPSPVDYDAWPVVLASDTEPEDLRGTP